MAKQIEGYIVTEFPNQIALYYRNGADLPWVRYATKSIDFQKVAPTVAPTEDRSARAYTFFAIFYDGPTADKHEFGAALIMGSEVVGEIVPIEWEKRMRTYTANLTWFGKILRALFG